MPGSERNDKKWTTQAAEKLLAVLNRADEIGGEVRDYLQDRLVTDPRYVSARKAAAKLLGRTREARDHAAPGGTARAKESRGPSPAIDPSPSVAREAKAQNVAPVRPEKTARGLGDPSIKAQIYGKRSCPWTGRAITLLERHKVDFDFIDLEEPEHEAKLAPLTRETKQNTVPYVFLRGKFVGGFNALSEIERLGQLEVALMSKEELAGAPAHVRSVEIVPRPNTDEIAPAEVDPVPQE